MAAFVLLGLAFVFSSPTILRDASKQSTAPEQLQKGVSALSQATRYDLDLSQEIDWAEGKVPVLIYTDEVSSVVDPTGRSFPTVKIWIKIGSSPHEELATIGKVGEYPNTIRLSPDKKQLLLNLESKLQLLDLDTKQIRDIFIPEKSTYLGAVFSPNSKELFVWDQFYSEVNDKQYFVHRLNLETLEDVLITTGNTGTAFGPIVWRDDSKVVLYEPMGEFARSWYFDFATNKIIETPNTNMSGFVSSDGKSMSVVSEWIDDICNEFAGSAWSGYKIVDPVSGTIQGQLKQQGRPATISAYSPDKRQILYATRENATDKSKCDEDLNSFQYYLSNYSGGTSESITYHSFMRLLNNWGYDNIGATIKYDYDNNSSGIYLNGKAIVTSNKGLEIVAQYLQ